MTAIEDARDEVLDVEDRRQNAVISADLAELDALLADDLTHVHSSGLVHDKAGFMDYVKRTGGFIGIERGPLDVRIEGAIAIINGSTISRVRALDTGAERVLEGFMTQVLRRTDHGWQFVVSQLTLFRK